MHSCGPSTIMHKQWTEAPAVAPDVQWSDALNLIVSTEMMQKSNAEYIYMYMYITGGVFSFFCSKYIYHSNTKHIYYALYSRSHLFQLDFFMGSASLTRMQTIVCSSQL